MNINHALSARSHFSMGESMLKPAELVKQASELGYESLALVDTMTVSGMIELTGKCKSSGIKPIVGCRLRVVEDPTYRKPKKSSGEKPKTNPEWYPKVYVKNEQGMKDLLKLLTKANSEEYFYYVPRIALSDLTDALSHGNLIVSTGDFHSAVHMSDCVSLIDQLRRAHSDSQTFVEISPINTPLFDTLNARAIQAARDLGLPLLMTCPINYEVADDANVLDVLAAINSNSKMTDKWRPVQYIRDFYMKPVSEYVSASSLAKSRINDDMGAAWCGSAWKEAILNTGKLVDMCDYVWEKQDVSLPKLVEDEYRTLVMECKKGWVERLKKPTMGYKPSAEDIPIYKERLKYELETLKSMGFERYFILVQDLVKWSKESGIIVGPGRGSVGGSLVAYLLGIADVDPIRFNLIFERFINPERLDLPDVDLDFMSSRRHEVIEYLVDKFGEDRVAGISNYGTLASSSALRDTGRVYNLSQTELKPTSYVPKEHGKPMSLTEAAAQVPELAEFKENHENVWKIATRLEGRMRSLGKHAAGVVVAGEPIENRAVVERRSNTMVVNWDKRSVEDWGLIKMDVLGLSTLDTLSDAVRLIKDRHRVDIDLIDLPLDDKEVLEAFGQGRSVGVFQFESSGMRKLLKDLAMGGDLTFEDLAAATALYRPGPMDSGLMDDYIAIRQGMKEPYYEHENMEAALKATQSVIVYQEQVMQLARDLAGFTMAGADHLRKAMGKKDKDKMAKMREQWVNGCAEHSGMGEKQSAALFDKIEAFAGYGFNRSHAVEYSIISYWTMWLKVRYPAEFYAAAMGITKEDKLPTLVSDAREQGIYVVPPEINKSSGMFEIGYDAAREQHILYAPFNRLKGLSDNTTKAILDAREKVGTFTSKKHFLESVNKTKCNKRHQDVLSRVGAFAEIELDEIPARHPDRLKDQMELMPGLIVDMVKADRAIDGSKETKNALLSVIHEMRACEKCDLAGGVHPAMSMGSKSKVMIVTDCPNWGEEQANKLFKGDPSAYLKLALKEAGLKGNDCYMTTLVKSPKNEKQLTNEQIVACSGYLKREVEILKPPVIVALGGASIRHFVPDAKGGFADLCGKVVYSAELDASIVFGINPMMCYVDGSRQDMLNDVLKQAADIVLGD